MDEILVLSESELRKATRLDVPLIDALADGYRKLSAGEVVMPPIMRIDLEAQHGEIDVKSAWVPGLDSLAIKMASGFFNNPTIGLPTSSGLMVLFSCETGRVKSVLLDNGYLTDVRTAAAGALAARTLARENIETVSIIGAGGQARWQLEALTQVREFSDVFVWARQQDRAEGFAKDMAERLGKQVHIAKSAEEAVRVGDIVVTTTPATEPVVQHGWLKPGSHLTAMGSDAEHKNEIAPEAIAAADIYATDNRGQCLRLGELRSAVAAGLVGDDAAELGDILAGKVPGRTSDDQITIADQTGTGMQDTIIARMAYASALEAGAGVKIGA